MSPAKAAPLPASPHPAKQGRNDRYRKLAIQMKRVTDLRLAVHFTPLREGEQAPVPLAISPLAK